MYWRVQLWISYQGSTHKPYSCGQEPFGMQRKELPTAISTGCSTFSLSRSRNMLKVKTETAKLAFREQRRGLSDGWLQYPVLSGNMLQLPAPASTYRDAAFVSWHYNHTLLVCVSVFQIFLCKKKKKKSLNYKANWNLLFPTFRDHTLQL